MPGDDATFELRSVRVGPEASPRLAVDHLALGPGGITVLSGPSGAGKSTLLRLLNRLDVPDAGEVRYDGRPLDDLDPRQLRRRVGMVFQRPTLFAGTVADNLDVAAPDASVEQRCDALRRAGLDADFLDRPGDRLSGGEAQRACLARTLLTEPRVLLLDEPTSALDQDATQHLERSVRALVADGVTAIWVSHDREQVQRVADHVVHLRDGRLEAS